MSCQLLSCVLLVVGVAASAQPERPESSADRFEEIGRLNTEVTNLTRQLGDWSGQHEMISNMVRNLWESNNWNSEADLFARDVAIEVEEVPPWRMTQRLELIKQAVTGRYNLTPQQGQQFTQQMFQEMHRMTLKYGPVLMPVAVEAFETRLKGEPFTAGQVQEWAKRFEPIMDDWRADVERMSAGFRKNLIPEQQDIFDRDYASLKRRLDYVTTSTRDWSAGRWTPEDWGMQDDPIQTGRRPRPPSPTVLLQHRVKPHLETTWRRYVSAFVDMYQLDKSQKKACLNVLEDLESRAAAYRRRHAEDIAEVPAHQQPQHEVLRPIREMFSELQARIDTIPTERQRSEAFRRNEKMLNAMQRHGKR